MESRTNKVSAFLHRKLGWFVEPHVLFPAFAVLFSAAIWGTVFYVVDMERSATDRTARSHVRELTETYEAQVLRAMREIDQSLKLLQYTWTFQDMAESIPLLERKRLLPPAYFFAISAFDDQGRMLATNKPENRESQSEDIADLLRQMRRQEGDQLLITPFRRDDEGGVRTLRFSRPLLGAESRLSGIAVIEVEASFFVSGYDPDDLGQQGLLGVLSDRDLFLAGRSGDAGLAGQPVDYEKLGPTTNLDETTVSLMTTPWDDLQRYVSARELNEFPVAVVVGVSRAEQFAPVAQRTRIYSIRAALINVVVLLVIAILWRMAFKLAEARQLEMDARIAHAKQVEYLAYHDGLTDLPNRSLFSKLLVQNISVCERYGKRLAVLFLDLDRFKHINDTLGHDVGDELLQEVARRLKGCLRESDVVARLGGDEFVVMLPELTEQAYVASVAHKMIIAVARPYRFGGESFQITVSIGISLYPDDGLDEQSLTKNADIAMYHAKEGGRNHYEFFSRKIEEDSLQRLTLESSLNHAMKRQEFRLYYQTKLDVITGRVSGMEALLRWEHPDLGTVAPMQFIPLAEEAGLMIPIGRWVLKTACEQNVAWQREGLPRMNIAVNLTVQQFLDPGLPETIRTTLAETGMDPELLELEISEGLLLRDVSVTLDVLDRLKEIGVRLVIDDFGVGYSSLAMLKQFPLDSIKIDRSFIREINQFGQGDNLTDAIVAMGRTLSMTVVAQGVETSDQADYLRDHAFSELQGFYFNKPMPPAELTALLKSQLNSFVGEPDKADR